MTTKTVTKAIRLGDETFQRIFVSPYHQLSGHQPFGFRIFTYGEIGTPFFEGTNTLIFDEGNTILRRLATPHPLEIGREQPLQNKNVEWPDMLMGVTGVELPTRQIEPTESQPGTLHPGAVVSPGQQELSLNSMLIAATEANRNDVIVLEMVSERAEIDLHWTPFYKVPPLDLTALVMSAFPSIRVRVEKGVLQGLSKEAGEFCLSLAKAIAEEVPKAHTTLESVRIETLDYPDEDTSQIAFRLGIHGTRRDALGLLRAISSRQYSLAERLSPPIRRQALATFRVLIDPVT